eukprot:6491536-Amphidinium_carterae.2
MDPAIAEHSEEGHSAVAAVLTDLTLHMVWFVRKKTKRLPTTVDYNLRARTSDGWTVTSTSTC